MKNSVLLFAISIVFATSCVSPKIHNSLVSENETNKKVLEQKDKCTTTVKLTTKFQKKLKSDEPVDEVKWGEVD